MRNYKFGRLPRKYNPRIPHLSALLSKSVLLEGVPQKYDDSKDYTYGMPDDFKKMLNNNYNDCVCAAYYHARQVWSFNAIKNEITEPDSIVRQLYIEACGYDGKSKPGPEASLSDVLTYVKDNGAPITPASGSESDRDYILGIVEIDHRNKYDIMSVIYDCGVVFIGFPQPSNVISSNPTWDYDPSASLSGNGHAVILAGYDSNGAIAISWGKRFKITWDFIAYVVDEVYAVIDKTWVSATGKTPAGMSLDELNTLMQNT